MTPTHPDISALLGTSPAMARVRDFARRAAEVEVSVLLLGETGAGKSLLARIIHGAGARSRRRFLVVNCAGVPDGLFESEFFGHQRGAFTGAQETRRGLFELAEGGTLFLDEVGEMRAPLQAKLLTVLEEGEVRRVGGDKSFNVDVRVISATSRDLGGDVSSGRFRRDLYHRLAVLRCVLPPLRHRPEDIPVLAAEIMRLLQRKHGSPGTPLSRAVEEHLSGLAWRGNVRELAHTLEAALILSGKGGVTVRSVEAAMYDGGDDRRDSHGAEGTPSHPGGRYSFLGSEQEERARILEALLRSRGNKTRAARELGMARNTLRAKLKRYGLDGLSLEGEGAAASPG
ncbi:sigma-54 interaction domain-containing protein [Gemmatimonadota bacterium]